MLAASLAVLGILALYWPTAASIVAIWIRSETFTHGFVVVPICLWLVWRRRESIARDSRRGPGGRGSRSCSPPVRCGSSPRLPTCSASSSSRSRSCCRRRSSPCWERGIARAAFFPLAFLLFAVPFGEIFVPTLIDWTADFTVAALRLSGVPVYREANLFIIPSGAWSVVEACSGIRYIIASVMIGTIYAALSYRSTRRRAMFIAAAILVPIVANWLRAYMIVMLGHLSNNKLAVGVDHIIYGWVFFGLVMLLLFWIGSFWQEDAAACAGGATATREQLAPAATPRVLFAAAVAAIVAAGVWLPLEARIDRSDQPSKASISGVAAANGWSDSALAFTDWKPRYRGYAAELQQTLTKDGHEVGLYIAYYRHQSKGSELITSGNQLVTPEDWKWKQVGKGSESIEWSGRPERVERADLSGQTTALQAYRLYWVAGHVTSSQYEAKALQAWSKLSGRGDDAALVVIYAPRRTRDDDPTPILRAFTSEMSPSIERALAATREAPRMSAMPPLIVHVVYRFDVGGLENGVVNLINRLPAQSWRHAVVSLTDVDPAFAARISRSNVRFIALHKAPGHAVRLYPRLVALLRELKPAIVHTRNLAALEATLPAWIAGVPARLHGEHGRDIGDLDGSNVRYQRVRRLYRPFVTPLRRAVARPRALPARAHRRARDADRADLQRRRHRALSPCARRARRDRRAARSRVPTTGWSAPSAGWKRSRTRPTWRARSSRARGRPRGPRAPAARPGRRRHAEARRRGDARIRRRARPGVVRRRARRRGPDAARSRLLRAAVARRGHFEHDPRGDGVRAAGHRDAGRRQRELVEQDATGRTVPRRRQRRRWRAKSAAYFATPGLARRAWPGRAAPRRTPVQPRTHGRGLRPRLRRLASSAAARAFGRGRCSAATDVRS